MQKTVVENQDGRDMTASKRPQLSHVVAEPEPAHPTTRAPLLKTLGKLLASRAVVFACVPGMFRTVAIKWLNEWTFFPPAPVHCIDVGHCDRWLAWLAFSNQFGGAVEYGEAKIARGWRPSPMDLQFLGASYAALGKFEAIESLLAQYGDADANPALAERACAMLAKAAFNAGRFSKALSILDAPATTGRPSYATLLIRAQALEALGKMSEARSAIDEAVSRQPLRVAGVGQRAFYLLKSGEILPGLREWANIEVQIGRYPVRSRCPSWTGEALQKQVLLVHFEHNFGDQLQFARFLKHVRERNLEATVVVECLPALRRLFAASFPWAIVSGLAPKAPRADLLCMSTQLPAILYLQSVEPRTAYLRAERPVEKNLRRDGKTVGICWRGRPLEFDLRRSIQVELMAQIIQRTDKHTPSVQWVCLQKDPTALERGVVSQAAGAIEFPAMSDFFDLAQIVMGIDLVVSVDTGVIHLAGALGVDALLLCRADRDWRWGSSGNHSPWYETIEVISHPGDMNWQAVADDCVERLRLRLTSDAATK